MEPVIQTNGLRRSYQSYLKAEGIRNSIKGFFSRQHIEKPALLPTDLTVHRGEVVGLVGANGAGKTTLIKLLSGLISPTAGSASVLGFTPWHRQFSYLRRISVLLGQKAQLWWDIPSADSFALLAKIYGLDSVVCKKWMMELAEILDVQRLLHVQLRRLSLGERMKMEIIGSLLHRPEVLFLDEPTIGLDIVAQTTIRKFLNEYVRTESPTIILTSHYMDDIARLASRLLLMSNGSMVYDGSVQEFTKKAKTQQRITLRLDSPLEQPLLFGGGVRIDQGKDTFTGELPQDDVGPFLQTLLRSAKLAEISIEQTDFEDVVHGFLAAESGMRQPIHSPAT